MPQVFRPTKPIRLGYNGRKSPANQENQIVVSEADDIGEQIGPVQLIGGTCD